MPFIILVHCCPPKLWTTFLCKCYTNEQSASRYLSQKICTRIAVSPPNLGSSTKMQMEILGCPLIFVVFFQHDPQGPSQKFNVVSKRKFIAKGGGGVYRQIHTFWAVPATLILKIATIEKKSNFNNLNKHIHPNF